jgi:hypothetical protein
MEAIFKAGDSLQIPEGCKADEGNLTKIPRGDGRVGNMDIRNLKIGDKVCNPQDGFPMIVVGLNSTLADLNKRLDSL